MKDLYPTSAAAAALMIPHHAMLMYLSVSKSLANLALVSSLQTPLAMSSTCRTVAHATRSL